MSIARVLTLIALISLAMASWLLGAAHPLVSVGWITLMTALICNLALPRPVTLSQQRLLVSIGVGAGLAFLCWHQHWLAISTALVPSAFQGLLAVLVGRTLFGNRVPAIERIACALHPEQVPFPADVRRYARRSTWLWCSVFTLLSVSHLWRALTSGFAHSNEFASLAVDLSLIGAVLLLEFAYRRWGRGDHNASNLWQFILALRRIDPLRLLLS